MNIAHGILPIDLCLER